MGSVYGDILIQAKAAIVALLPRWINELPVTVEVRKLPTAQQDLDTLPYIAITPEAVAGRQEWISNTRVKREHRFQCAIIIGADRDPVTGFDELNQLRQDIIRAFTDGTPFVSPGGADVLRTWVDPVVIIDRTAYNENYDYSVIGVMVACIETP